MSLAFALFTLSLVAVSVLTVLYLAACRRAAANLALARTSGRHPAGRRRTPHSPGDLR